MAPESPVGSTAVTGQDHCGGSGDSRSRLSEMQFKSTSDRTCFLECWLVRERGLKGSISVSGELTGVALPMREKT